MFCNIKDLLIYISNFSGGRGSASAGMIRSISVPSVNGGFVDDGGFRSDSRGSGINSVMDSQMGGNRADYGSMGNMQLGMQQDEQVSS